MVKKYILDYINGEIMIPEDLKGMSAEDIMDRLAEKYLVVMFSESITSEERLCRIRDYTLHLQRLMLIAVHDALYAADVQVNESLAIAGIDAQVRASAFLNKVLLKE